MGHCGEFGEPVLMGPGWTKSERGAIEQDGQAEGRRAGDQRGLM